MITVVSSNKQVVLSKLNYNQYCISLLKTNVVNLVLDYCAYSCASIVVRVP